MENHFGLLSVNFMHKDHLILAGIWGIRGNQIVVFSITLSEIRFY